MDKLYYSNYCKFSRELISYLTKNNLADKINCVCIDNRTRDKQTGQILVKLENGRFEPIPPNVSRVPSILLVSKGFSVIFGNAIYQYFEPTRETQQNIATGFNGEPVAYSGKGADISSEKFTFYNMSSEELSPVGEGGMRQIHNYVPVNGGAASAQTAPIPTEQNNYKSTRIKEFDLDALTKERDAEIMQMAAPDPFSSVGTGYSMPSVRR